VALSGPADAPRFRARWEFALTSPGLAVQPYHAAAGLDLAAAEQLIGQVGRGAEQAAAAGLRSVADLRRPQLRPSPRWAGRRVGPGGRSRRTPLAPRSRSWPGRDNWLALLVGALAVCGVVREDPASRPVPGARQAAS
jgi:hypothetical protein